MYREATALLRLWTQTIPRSSGSFVRIPERGDRVLRVAVNTRVAPWRVVSVFFDRSMRLVSYETVNVDKEADALYLRLDDSPIVESEEVSPGVVLDYNESNEVVGVEMLHLSKRSSNLDLSALHFETA